MRYELTIQEWIAIRPMLPNKPRGVPRVNDRRVAALHESVSGTKLPFAAFKTTSAFWGTAVEKCSL